MSLDFGFEFLIFYVVLLIWALIEIANYVFLGKYTVRSVSVILNNEAKVCLLNMSFAIFVN